MQKAIIGKKVGMTQIFDEKGNVIPVTVIEAGPCTVVQKKTVENDGYASVQLGFEDLADKKVNKPMKGHFEKAGVSAKKYLKEFRLDKAAEMNVGDVVKADVFAAGDKIDVIGTSKGKRLLVEVEESPLTYTLAAILLVLMIVTGRIMQGPSAKKHIMDDTPEGTAHVAADKPKKQKK